jgi:hypothetical protein
MLGGPGAIVPARVAERLAPQQAVVDGQALVELLGPDRPALVRLERGPAVVQRPQAHAHDHPAVAEPVNRGHRGREVPGPPA